MQEKIEGNLMGLAEYGDRTAMALMNEYKMVESRLESEQASLKNKAERVQRKAQTALDFLDGDRECMTVDELQSAGSDYDESIAKIKGFRDRLESLERIISRFVEQEMAGV